MTCFACFYQVCLIIFLLLILDLNAKAIHYFFIIQFLHE